MLAARIQGEREFWSHQLDSTSIEEAKTFPGRLRWIDAEEPGDAPRQQSADPPSGDRFTLWDV
jgi:hypothetical protein